MDGKYIVVKQPQNSGSYYFNYKGTFSIVLLALVDAEYKFIYVDVGCNWRISDGGVYQNVLYPKLLTKTFYMYRLPDHWGERDDFLLPHVIVADDAFTLRENIMKPYTFRSLAHEKKIFNYRLSRARRIVENAFGILANRFRVFLSPMLLSPENVEKVTLASCTLHNLLREHPPSEYTPPGTFDLENIETGSVKTRRLVFSSRRRNAIN